jgi:LysR family glycine cleavage system transcriptional activator
MFPEHPERPSWARWATLARVDLGDAPSARFSHASMALAAAAAGQGVALGRSSLVAADIAEGRLACPFGPRFPSPFSYWLVSPPGGLKRPRVRRLIDWLSASIQADTAALVGRLP